MIKREFLDGRIVIYNADCIDVMKEIGDKEIDLVLTDPPYGGGSKESDWDNKKRGRFGGWFNKYHIQVERTGGGYAEKYGKDIKHWDFAPDAACFDEIFRISKEQIIWGGNYFELPATRCFLIWKKLTISENFSMAMAEYAWTSFNKNAKIFEAAPQDPERFHPTQKPVSLIAWCINNYSKEHDLIFDGFLGSGTTAISCIRTNRRLIGSELDPVYFEKMCERIEVELRQGNLF
jgi:site-specific DNA-methyltransferase (adenine-specific)